MRAAGALAGCYALAVGAWSAPQAHGGHLPHPPRVHLDTAHHARRQPGLELVAQTPGFAVRGPFARSPAWSPVGTDSLQVLAWADGTSSVTLFLRRRTARTLEGTARYFTDGIVLDPVTKRWLWEQYPTAPASLQRAPCD